MARLEVAQEIAANFENRGYDAYITSDVAGAYYVTVRYPGVAGVLHRITIE